MILAGTNFAFPKGKLNNLLTFLTKSHFSSFQNFTFKGKGGEGRATTSSHGIFFSIIALENTWQPEQGPSLTQCPPLSKQGLAHCFLGTGLVIKHMEHNNAT